MAKVKPKFESDVVEYLYPTLRSIETELDKWADGEPHWATLTNSDDACWQVSGNTREGFEIEVQDASGSSSGWTEAKTLGEVVESCRGFYAGFEVGSRRKEVAISGAEFGTRDVLEKVFLGLTVVGFAAAFLVPILNRGSKNPKHILAFFALLGLVGILGTTAKALAGRAGRLNSREHPIRFWGSVGLGYLISAAFAVPWIVQLFR